MKDDLRDLTNLEILDIKSNIIEIIESNALDSFGSRIKRLLLSMPNISNENIYSLKNSLKPNRVPNHFKYYSATHIENRVNIDCSKTLYFMKFKILYNFLNEHIDIDDFLKNCMNLTQLRNNLNYLENSTFYKNEEIFAFYSKDCFIPTYTPLLFIFISLALFTLLCIYCMFSKEFKANLEKLIINNQNILFIFNLNNTQDTKSVIDQIYSKNDNSFNQMNEITNENDETIV